MALQLSRPPTHPAQSPYLNAEKYAISQAGPAYAWHIDKNVAEPVAVAMLPALTGQIAQRGLLMLVCDASIDAPQLRSFAAAAAAQAILRNYYYKSELSNYSYMLFQAMLEGIREANDEVAHRFWPHAEQTTSLTLTDNLAGISATAVVAYDNKLLIGTLGNTRAYRIRNGKLAMYEQGEPEQLIVLKDSFRKGDRVFVCTCALAEANGTGRIRAAAQTSIAGSPGAMRTLIEGAEQVDTGEIIAAAMLYRTVAAPALLTTSRPAAPPRAAPAARFTRWLTLASVLILLAVGTGLLVENQRARLATTLKLKLTPAVTATQLPVATGLIPVPVLAGNTAPAAPAVSNTSNLSVVITTSEAGIVVFQLAATETPAPLTPTPEPTRTLQPSLRPSATNSPTPTVAATATQTPTVVRATATAKPAATKAPPQPTSPPPQPTSPPPQPTSPPPQPTSPPPQPTSPPPQPTSPPPQPTSPPPQPTSPPPPPQPTPDLVLPCLPGDTQCKP